ncbi:hypothetical protein EDC96DRAFT_98052 [Choanephora cucurbitarum]|nr:hypothetical protein EDC96DRAFT_98052 [Choanephora cucurbitarum]
MNSTTSYPSFHPTYTQTKSSKDIDASVYHLLSLYLTKDALTNTTTLLKRPTKPSPRTYLHRTFQSQRSWLGEETREECDTVLERNTIKNAFIQVTQTTNTTLKKKKKRAKAVSFSNTVTVVLSEDNVSTTHLNREDEEEEDCFVDALEYIR